MKVSRSNWGEPIARNVALLLCIFLLTFSSCLSLKAKEAEDSGFLAHPNLMKTVRERFPFDEVWLVDFSEGFFDCFENITVAEVDTTHLLKMQWLDTMSLEGRERVKEDAKQIATYMRKSFITALREEEEPRFQYVENSEKKTLILELALVELVPTKAWLSTSGAVAGFFLPGVGVLSGFAASGSIAIEGRLRDGTSGEVVAMFKDRESDQFAPIGIQDYTWYHHATNAIDDWAEQVTEILNTPPDHPVADSLPLTLRMW